MPKLNLILIIQYLALLFAFGTVIFIVCKEMQRVCKKTKQRNVASRCKKAKTSDGTTCFKQVYQPFTSRYVSKSKSRYIIRSFQNKDIEILHALDIKMTFDLLANNEKPYGEYLDLITNVNRKRFHHWRSITCSNANNDKAVGFIIYYLYRRTKHVELFWIGVDTKYQRQGIAKRLIKTMIDESYKEWGIKRFKLNVLSHNTAAIRFYNKLGFIRGDYKRNYPVNGYNSYRYSLSV